MTLVQEQGVKSLWKGLGATIIRVFFGAGSYFVILHSVSDMLDISSSSYTNNKLSSSETPVVSNSWLNYGIRSFIAGVSARSIAAAIMSPIAVVKTRMEFMDIRSTLSLSQYKNTYQALKYILHTEGWASLYSGLIPTIARDAPFSGIYYTSYNYIKNILAIQNTIITINNSYPFVSDSSSSSSSLLVHIATFLEPYPTVRNFLAGLGGGIFATFITHPADVLKTRLQLKVSH